MGQQAAPVPGGSRAVPYTARGNGRVPAACREQPPRPHANGRHRSLDRSIASPLPWLLLVALVPKLCLGTDFAKLCFASASHAIEGDAKRSFADGVPKLRLGTRSTASFGREP